MKSLRPIPDAIPNSRDQLADAFMDCSAALMEAVLAMKKHFPHARNYQSDEGLRLDAAEMNRRIRIVQELSDQFGVEADSFLS